MLGKLALLPLLALAAVAHADPLVPATLPQETRWVIHINADAFRASPLDILAQSDLLQRLEVRAEVHAEAQTASQPAASQSARSLEDIQRLTGVNIKTDLHDVTLFSTSFDEQDVCLAIHAPFKRALILAFLQRNPDFASEVYQGHDILSWRDKQRDTLVHGTFVDNDHVLIAQNPKNIKLALDARDGRAPALKPASFLVPPLPAGAAPATGPAQPASGPILWLAATNVLDLPRMQKVDSPILQQVENARFDLGCSDERLAVHATIMATSDKTAAQMATAIEGLKAIVALQAADDHAAPRVKLLSSVMQGLSTTTDSKTLNADWSVGVDKIEALLQTIPASAPAASKP